MSSPELRLILSPQAEEDFADILQYTLETWGEAQFYAYRTVINDALLTLQQHPYIGRLRPELSPHHRLFPAGQHVIIYRVSDVAVSVSRILHGRMDIGKQL